MSHAILRIRNRQEIPRYVADFDDVYNNYHSKEFDTDPFEINGLRVWELDIAPGERGKTSRGVDSIHGFDDVDYTADPQVHVSLRSFMRKNLGLNTSMKDKDI